MSDTQTFDVPPVPVAGEPAPVDPPARGPRLSWWTTLAVGIAAVLVGALLGFGLGRATGGTDGGGGPGGFGGPGRGGGFPGQQRQPGQQFGGPQSQPGQPGQQFGGQPSP